MLDYEKRILIQAVKTRMERGETLEAVLADYTNLTQAEAGEIAKEIKESKEVSHG